MKNQDRIFIDYLNDIWESIINFFLNQSDYQAFRIDIKTQYAVIRALQIIDKASKSVISGQKYPLLPV
jgi:uncharacterized protein with HEPN domain